MDLYRKIAGAMFVTVGAACWSRNFAGRGTGSGASQIRGKRTSAVWRMLTIKGGRHNRFPTDGYSSSSFRKMADV